MSRRHPLAAAVPAALAILLLAVSAAHAVTITPAGKAFTLKSTNLTATFGQFFTMDCGQSTITATTADPAAATVSTADTNVTIGGAGAAACTATVLFATCGPTVTVGAGDWTLTAGALVSKPDSFAATVGLGTTGDALKLDLTGCLKTCVVTVAASAIANGPTTPVLWTNATMPTLQFTSALVPFTPAGCAGIAANFFSLTASYNLTTAPDIDFT